MERHLRILKRDEPHSIEAWNNILPGNDRVISPDVLTAAIEKLGRLIPTPLRSAGRLESISKARY